MNSLNLNLTSNLGFEANEKAENGEKSRCGHQFLARSKS